MRKVVPEKCAKQGVFLEGKIQKMPKKFLKNFIVPKRSLGLTDPIDTYKGHILVVNFQTKIEKKSFTNH